MTGLSITAREKYIEEERKKVDMSRWPPFYDLLIVPRTTLENEIVLMPFDSRY